MKTKWLKYLPYLLLFIVISFLIIRANHLKTENTILKTENSELVHQIKDLQEVNDTLAIEVSDLMERSDSLEDSCNELRNIKNKAQIRLVEVIKEAKPDTILVASITALNQANDTLIGVLENTIQIKTEVIAKQQKIIDNDKIIIEDFQKLLKESEALYIKERKKKTFWQITTATATGAAIVLAFI